MMTTNKLTKTFASGSLAIGIATLSSVAGSLLVAPSAQAVQVFCNTGGSWTVGDKTISDILCDGFTTPDSFLRFAQSGLTYDFGGLFDPLENTAGSVSYKLQINGPKEFAGVELDSNCDAPQGGACNVNKKVWGDALNGTNLLADLYSFNGEEDFGSLSGQTIYVLDSWTPTDPAALSGIENAYTQTVPEPGTILGLLAVGGLGLVSRFKKQK
ncbi:PEP-CTERM sorting domain-containing protein [Microcystis aeruginosa]|uniref:Ice-binding protein C-terminal domain-containing protein n=1 Tax=Microcystis aeruginosa NIES-3807 TaxID=2517785 RepID=A0AAD3GA52_MICAE|nr:PEP-CTERM sorting domain-containing protein [Microcystis aeruginosa]GCL60456.1 hypothetical protein NIES3807_36410 [Microcystis aeruginosa NIES-3807]